MGKSRPVGIGLLQIALHILMPKLPRLLVMLHHEAAVQDLKILYLDGRKLVDRSRVATEAAELRRILGRVLCELGLMRGSSVVIRGALVGGRILRVAFDWFVVGEVTDRIIALKSESAFVDVLCFPCGRDSRGHEESDGDEE